MPKIKTDQLPQKLKEIKEKYPLTEPILKVFESRVVNSSVTNFPGLKQELKAKLDIPLDHISTKELVGIFRAFQNLGYGRLCITDYGHRYFQWNHTTLKLIEDIKNLAVSDKPISEGYAATKAESLRNHYAFYIKGIKITFDTKKPLERKAVGSAAKLVAELLKELPDAPEKSIA